MELLEHLNANYSIDGLLSFTMTRDGVIAAEIDTPLASAAISLGGGHLLHWQPKNHAHPVIWLSEQAKIAPGKSIRGGVPICWPWFGAHSQSGFPAHGHARTTNWNVIKTKALNNGEIEIELMLEESEKSKSFWPYSTPLTIHITVGKQLKIALTTQNDSSDTVSITEALHTYFHIGDIGAISITGLENCDYFDKVENFARKTQHGSIGFSGETDRVYINTEAECVINDSQLHRRIHITKSSSSSTVVWTPWADKANAMGDLGANDGWRRMVCVESANAMENTITIAPGKSHTLSVEYRVEPI